MNKEKIKLTMIGIIMLPLIGFFYDAYNGFHVLRNSRSLYGIYASLVVTAILAFAGEYISEVINRKDKVSDPLCKRFFHLFIILASMGVLGTMYWFIFHYFWKI